jgi:hypothetical protein
MQIVEKIKDSLSHEESQQIKVAHEEEFSNPDNDNHTSDRVVETEIYV